MIYDQIIYRYYYYDSNYRTKHTCKSCKNKLPVSYDVIAEV